MKFRLHPVLLPFFLFLIMTGSISIYALIFVSLLIHEAGHLIAAYLTGMRVRSCTIMPYGGEIVIWNRHLAPRRERLHCRARWSVGNGSTIIDCDMDSVSG